MSAPPVPLVLVDGSNVARCSAWRSASGVADDADLRTRLVDALCTWAPVAGVEVQLVFDGAGPWRAGKVRASADVVVIGSGRADGDDVLERRASNAYRDGRAYWLATSDNALRQVAGARADRVIGADEFVAEVHPQDTPVDAPDATPTRVTETLDDDTRAKLERMRRGLDPSGG